jgi:hypothetical protein
MSHRALPLSPRWLAAALLGGAVACGGDETQPNEDHTPVSYTLSVDGSLATPPIHLIAGETVLVRVQFLNAAGENLDDVESSHFAGLTFQPAALATAVRRADHHFQFDVTGGTQGSGTVTVGFGHDDAADEDTLPSSAVTVSGGGGGNPNLP